MNTVSAVCRVPAGAEAEERVDGAHEPGVPGFEQRAQFLARCRLRVVVEQFNLKQVEQDVLLVAGQAFSVRRSR